MFFIRTNNGNVNINGLNHLFDTQIQTCTNEGPSQGIRGKSPIIQSFMQAVIGEKKKKKKSIHKSRNGHLIIFYIQTIVQ